MLDEVIELTSAEGAREVVFGMAHRGRLNVLAHTVGRPYEAILAEFEGEQTLAVDTAAPEGGTGDVKYHYGASGTYATSTGRGVTVTLSPNPSHLEYVNPVIEGRARADQTSRKARDLTHDPAAVVPVLIHGDAAFPGQGIVAETLNLQALPGYTTGGTIHVIANNQLGFTTDPEESRSTRYASDPAKGFDMPIIHVNADDVEACIAAVRLATDFRQTFGRDALIDLIGYRRFGHNETDEPAYTQPQMYELIKKHPPVRKLYAERLESEGVVSAADAEKMAEDAYAKVGEAHEELKRSMGGPPETGEIELDRTMSREPRTTVAEDTAARTRRAAPARARGLHRAPQAEAVPRAPPRGLRRGRDGRLGARRGARVRVAARARGARAADRPGHGARHLQPAPRGPARREHRRALGAAPAPARCQRALRAAQQPALRAGLRRLRVRLLGAGARRARAVGGAVRRLRQLGSGDDRPVPRVRDSPSGARPRACRCCCRTATRAPAPSTRAHGSSASCRRPPRATCASPTARRRRSTSTCCAARRSCRSRAR